MNMYIRTNKNHSTHVPLVIKLLSQIVLWEANENEDIMTEYHASNSTSNVKDSAADIQE